jgi:hypothetical protein
MLVSQLFGLGHFAFATYVRLAKRADGARVRLFLNVMLLLPQLTLLALCGIKGQMRLQL